MTQSLNWQKRIIIKFNEIIKICIQDINNTSFPYTSFQVLTAFHLTPCSLIGKYRRFGVTCCPHRQRWSMWRISWITQIGCKEGEHSRSKPQHWTWKQHLPSKRRRLSPWVTKPTSQPAYKNTRSHSPEEHNVVSPRQAFPNDVLLHLRMNPEGWHQRS
jgi:hypothetical protein